MADIQRIIAELKSRVGDLTVENIIQADEIAELSGRLQEAEARVAELEAEKSDPELLDKSE